MDLVTQGLLGATVAQAGYSKKIGAYSPIYGFVLGLVPDFDIVTGLFGPWVSLKYHRGPTHSFLVLPLIAIPIGLLLKKITRSGAPTKYWVGMSLWCLMTHPIIDWFTTYGTCLFWPVTSRRYAIDALSVIDFIFTLPLLFAFFIGFIKLFNAVVRMRIAVVALIISTFYAGLGYYNSQQVVAAGRQLFVNEGFEPVAVRATPTMMNIKTFRVVAKDAANRFMISYLSAPDGKMLVAPKFFESDDNEFVAKALEHEHGKLFKWFAMDMIVARHFIDEKGTNTVVLQDMRYGMLTAPDLPLFSATVEFFADGSVKRVKRNSPRDITPLMKKDMKATLSHVFTRAPLK